MGEKLMSVERAFNELAVDEYMHHFTQFLDRHVDGRLKATLTEDNQIEKLESKIEKLEVQVYDLESQASDYEDRLDTIENYGDMDDRFDVLEEKINNRFNDLEKNVQNSDHSQILKDISAMVNQQITALITAGRLSLHLKPPIEIVDTSEEPYKVQRTY